MALNDNMAITPLQQHDDLFVAIHTAHWHVPHLMYICHAKTKLTFAKHLLLCHLLLPIPDVEVQMSSAASNASRSA